MGIRAAPPGHLLAEAVYAIIAPHGIAYSVEPASFEVAGWTEAGGDDALAPLFLLPVELTETVNRHTTSQIREAWEFDHTSSRTGLPGDRNMLEALIQNLDRYPAAVHEPGPAGVSAWDACAELCALEAEHVPDAFAGLQYEVPSKVFQNDAVVRDVRRVLGRLVGSLETLRRTAHREAWSLVGPGASSSPEELGRAVETLREALDDCLDPAIGGVLAATSPATWEMWATWVDAVERGDAIRPADLAACSGPAFDFDSDDCWRKSSCTRPASRRWWKSSSRRPTTSASTTSGTA